MISTQQSMMANKLLEPEEAEQRCAHFHGVDSSLAFALNIRSDLRYM